MSYHSKNKTTARFVDVKIWNEVSTSEKKLKNYLNRTGKSEKLLKIEFGIKDLKKKETFQRIVLTSWYRILFFTKSGKEN